MSSFVDYWFATNALGEEAYPWWMQMDVHGDPNSFISQSSASSSYAHRDKLWLFQFSASPFNGTSSDFDGPIAFVKGLMGSLTDHMVKGDEWGRYANYIDSELDRDEALEQYFAESLGRLKEVKARFDPDELFYNPQSVGA